MQLMNYVYAIVLSLVAFLAYVAIGATLEWNNGGGVLPMMMLMGTIGWIWKRTLARNKEVRRRARSRRRDTESGKQEAERPPDENTLQTVIEHAHEPIPPTRSTLARLLNDPTALALALSIPAWFVVRDESLGGQFCLRWAARYEGESIDNAYNLCALAIVWSIAVIRIKWRNEDKLRTDH